MQMPERVFEDETSQFAPVSGNHWVTVLTPIYNGQTSAGTLSGSFVGDDGTTVTGGVDGGPIVVGESPGGIMPGMKQTLKQSVINGESISYHAEVQGGGTFYLQVTPEDPEASPVILYSEDLGRGEVLYTGDINLKDGVGGKLEAVYSGNRIDGGQIKVSNLYYASQESEAGESYVIHQCDDDDNEFSLRHRFGFNGQHKDDEIAVWEIIWILGSGAMIRGLRGSHREILWHYNILGIVPTLLQRTDLLME